MTDEYLKQQMKDLMKQVFGLVWEDIPEMEGERRPDFQVTSLAKDVTIVELKAKGDDPSGLEEETAALRKGGIVSRAVPLNRRNTLSGIIEDGVEQLKSYGTPDTFRVLWLHSWGRDRKLLRDRFHATLYGTTSIVDLNGSASRTGFFVDFNDFYRYRDVLEGAVLTTESEAQLCINSLSDRAEVFRGSGFVAAFAKGLCDPGDLERRGEAYVADCDLDRRKRNEVMNYIRKKYGRDRLMDIDLQYHSAAMTVPVDGNESR